MYCYLFIILDIFFHISIFLAGLVGCLGVIVFYPFAAVYHYKLLPALSTGMGCSGLVAALLAIAQNPAAPRFSVTWFFVLEGVLIVFSLASFMILKFHPLYNHISPYENINTSASRVVSEDVEDDVGPDRIQESEETEIAPPAPSYAKPHRSIVDIVQDIVYQKDFPLAYIAMQVFICADFYILTGIGPYAVYSYPNSADLLMWMNIGGAIAGTVGRLVTGLLGNINVNGGLGMRAAGMLSVFSAVLSVYLLAMVFGGPSMQHAGGWIIVIINCLFNGVYGFTDTLIFLLARRDHTGLAGPERVIRIISVANQVGAFVGSVTSFALTIGLLAKS
eukprot:TRINITY_DN4191_c0_g1_i3.p1 TRINITY_DN4191_c0_g1~~TRINITY_DN4191_c0_g1_i3.p1  ORF type:complete len:334 (-),score=34.95 TRINITY_DN4191_c0_g1_i3:62-1063(-)